MAIDRLDDQDPFYTHGVAEYRFIVFKPTKAVEGLHSRLFSN
ncbi:hypothetical protein [Paenibacillus profundus]|nr:hypothetical protein [Paenibacillus profundus]